MPIFFEVPIDIYPVRIYVSVAQSDKELCKSLPAKYRNDTIWRAESGGECTAFTCPLEEGAVFLRFQWPPDSPYRISVYSHEIFHATHYVMDYITHPLGNWKSGEPVAYFLSYITRKIFERLDA